jgi:hypothetical protein
MAQQRRNNAALKPLSLTGRGFDGVEVYLAPHEIKACQRAVLEGSPIKVYEEESKGVAGAVKYDTFRKCPDVKLYMEWFKGQIQQELIINTDIILKKLAATLAVDLNDFYDENTGVMKDLKDLSELARGQLKASWQYDANGKAKNLKVELVPFKDVLDILTKMSSVDNELVKTLVAKVASPEVLVNKQ